MGAMSIGHWVIVLVVVAIVFGPKRLAGLGQGLGEGIKGLKDGFGAKSSMIVAEESYEISEPTIDSHVVDAVSSQAIQLSAVNWQKKVSHETVAPIV